MPVYAYRGVGAGNRSTRGTVDAESLRDARTKLRSEGIFPTSLVEGQAKAAKPLPAVITQLKLPELRGVPDMELTLFTNQLATLLNAGVPLMQSLDALTEQIEHVKLKTIVAKLREDVNQGANLADAMAQHTTFGQLYCSMVRAGESAGALSIVLERLGDYIEARMKLRNQITSAMMYPALMLSMSVIVLGVMLVYVIPQLTQMLLDLKRELPLITKIVIALSNVVSAYWAPVLLLLLAAAIAFNRAIQTPRGRLVWDRFRMQAPLVGKSVRLISISRFARTLSTLLAGGVPIVQALEIARTTSGNAVIGQAVEAAKEAITRGSSIAQTLRQSGQFPPLVTHMVSVGEAAGELDTMLGRVSDTYDELVEQSLKRMLDLLGPVLLMFVAGVVVTIIMSVLLPLLDLTSGL